jgi:glutamine amidotransferase
MKIAIVDSGMGNTKAVQNVFHSIGIHAERIKEPDQFGKKHSHLVVPGVGSFDAGVDSLFNSGWWDLLRRGEFNQPVLGICLGMQMLFEGSDEGAKSGLGKVNGRIQSFDNEIADVPLIGWMSVEPTQDSLLFKDLNLAKFYFSHSYALKEKETKDNESIIARVPHVEPFAAAIHQDRWFGVQFHPEKSHNFGKKLLKNFVELT